MLFPDFDLFFITAGSMAIVWPDGQRFVAKTGTFALIPPLVPVRISRGAATLKYWFCHFNFRVGPGSYSERMERDFSGPAPDVNVPFLFSAAQAPEVHRAHRALTRLRFDAPAPPWRYEAALLRLVGELNYFGWKNATQAAAVAPAATVQDARLTAVLQKIHTEPERPWTVTELAASVGLSTDRLNMIARRLTNRSVKELQIRARFELAFTLLRQRPHGETPSIKEVSAQCGFSSQHFFCRQFKQYFQITPSEFRDGVVGT